MCTLSVKADHSLSSSGSAGVKTVWTHVDGSHGGTRRLPGRCVLDGDYSLNALVNVRGIPTMLAQLALC